jgi:hypothetical protein
MSMSREELSAKMEPGLRRLFGEELWDKEQKLAKLRLAEYREKENMAKNREHFLREAEELINGPRAEDYGPALLNHERIATIWNVLLRAKLLNKITPTEVTAMMIGLKLARLAEDMHKDDSWVDIIGYAALGGEISNDEQKTSV